MFGDLYVNMFSETHAKATNLNHKSLLIVPTFHQSLIFYYKLLTCKTDLYDNSQSYFLFPIYFPFLKQKQKTLQLVSYW